jgi:hypothetical protein
VFCITFSLATLTGPALNNLHLPSVNLVRANLEPCQTHGASGACSQLWYPAGSAMNTLLASIFTDSTAEYVNLQSPSPTIDFTDSPCTPSVCSTLTTSPNFLVTAPVGEMGYYEIQYMLANNFWGCNFNFGNSACGVEIRQGIAHMIDKTVFTSTELSISGVATPIDNPVPTTSTGGLTTPNPCSYDASFPQSGPQCVPGSPGGTSYHLGPSAGADGIPWLQAPGSPDLNAAARHFVNAGIATGFSNTTSVLTGINPAAASNTIQIFIRNDDPPRLHLGQGLQAQICYLFTASYTAPCPYLTTILGPNTAFPGFATSNTSVSLSWWMYTASYNYIPYFDDSLYFTYNSRFVSGIPAIQSPTGPCSAASTPTNAASNYMYLCNSAYDSISTQMETAPSIAQAVSLGVQAESTFGSSAFTLPIFERTIQFGYLNNGWIRAINSDGRGLPNSFTWLNAWNPSPPLAGTIRQGFSQTTRSVNPYIASTPQDLYIVGNIYDTLTKANPLSPSQVMNWMTRLAQTFPNNMLTYTPPPNTVISYRFTFPNDIYFQDGRLVTIYDVAFSYLSMVASGAFLSGGASAMTGITILSSIQFDINLNSQGPFTLPNLTSLPILPGRYWTSATSLAWDASILNCTQGKGCPMTQYTISGTAVNCLVGDCTDFPASFMTVDPTKTTAVFDPIANHTFVGSGPFQCGTITVLGSGICTSTGFENPPIGGGYTLTRFGTGFAPASSTTGIYFHSPGDLALFLWGCGGQSTITINCYAAVILCFGQPLGFCPQYQKGIGASSTGIVGVNQVAYVVEHFNDDWLTPFNWATNPPLGIGTLAPILYEGSTTLNPGSVAGCTMPYPIGGYDC